MLPLVKGAWVMLVIVPLLLAGCSSPASPAEQPPVRYSLGADAASAGAPGSLLSAVEIAPDGSSFTARVIGVAGATLRIDELLLLENHDAAPHEFTLEATAATSAATEGALQERLDLVDAQGATLASLGLAPGVSPLTTLVLAPHAPLRIALTLAAPEQAATGPASSVTFRSTVR